MSNQLSQATKARRAKIKALLTDAELAVPSNAISGWLNTDQTTLWSDLHALEMAGEVKRTKLKRKHQHDPHFGWLLA